MLFSRGPEDVTHGERSSRGGVLSTEGSVVDLLRRRILGGELGVGDRLRQSDLAQELGVSTTPVREALRSLTAEGLVEIDTHRGAVIRRLSDEEVVEVLELQLMLEQASLRASVPMTGEQVLDRATGVHERMLVTEDPVEWALLNRDFHLTLASASPRQRTQRMLRELLNVSTVQLRQDIADWDGRREVGCAEHAELLDAARQHDVEAAITVISRHTGAAIQHRLDIISAQR